MNIIRKMTSRKILSIRKVILFAMCMVMILDISHPVNAQINYEKENISGQGEYLKKIENHITVEEFIEKLVIATKLKVDSNEEKPYIAAAYENGLILEGEFTQFDLPITLEQVALLINRGDELLNGTEYDSDLYEEIKEKKRISDLNKISTSNRDEVIKVYAKGIMIGSYNGTYSHSRSFCGKDKLKVSTANLILKRLVNPSKRKKLSPDGQLIRTTKLPKNYKDFPYVLTAFPNKFYEKKYRVEKIAVTPVKTRKKTLNGNKMTDVFEAYGDRWTEKVETNLDTRLNVNYKTVNNKWITRLANTYYVYELKEHAYMNKRRTDDIKEYLSEMKKNKVIVKGSCSVEPSTLYYSVGYYMRACIKFKVVSAKDMNLHQEVMYGSEIYLDNLKKNKWYTRYVEINLGTMNGRSDGGDYAVVEDMMY